MDNRTEKGESIILTDNSDVKYSLIFLHGFGQKIQSFLQLFKHETSPLYFGFKIILIQAPFRKIIASKFNGAILPAWMNSKQWNPLRHLQHPPDEDILKQAYQSVDLISSYVDTQIQYWKSKNVEDPSKRIFICGFSQGCSLTLQYILNKNLGLGGAIGLGGVILKSNPCKYIGLTPIYIYLGIGDQIIPAQIFYKVYERIRDKIHYEQIDMKDIEPSLPGTPYNRHKMSTQTFFPYLIKTLKELIRQ